MRGSVGEAENTGVVGRPPRSGARLWHPMTLWLRAGCPQPGCVSVPLPGKWVDRRIGFIHLNTHSPGSKYTWVCTLSAARGWFSDPERSCYCARSPTPAPSWVRQQDWRKTPTGYQAVAKACATPSLNGLDTEEFSIPEVEGGCAVSEQGDSEAPHTCWLSKKHPGTHTGTRWPAPGQGGSLQLDPTAPGNQSNMKNSWGLLPTWCVMFIGRVTVS